MGHRKCNGMINEAKAIKRAVGPLEVNKYNIVNSIVILMELLIIISGHWNDKYTKVM